MLYDNKISLHVKKKKKKKKKRYTFAFLTTKGQVERSVHVYCHQCYKDRKGKERKEKNKILRAKDKWVKL